MSEKKQTRNAFEAWIKTQTDLGARVQVQLDRSPHTGAYTSPGVQLAWLSYCAATSRLSTLSLRLLVSKARERTGASHTYTEHDLLAMIHAAMDAPGPTPRETRCDQCGGHGLVERTYLNDARTEVRLVSCPGPTHRRTS